MHLLPHPGILRSFTYCIICRRSITQNKHEKKTNKAWQKLLTQFKTTSWVRLTTHWHRSELDINFVVALDSFSYLWIVFFCEKKRMKTMCNFCNLNYFGASLSLFHNPHNLVIQSFMLLVKITQIFKFKKKFNWSHICLWLTE